ncbi:Protein canopy-like protein 2 [Armadillidium nasatum]|uniref:Protein canopy-like protein 2 n=1 Tax=Armadillidium nasatum TaxID=96803 RepID=A0A5N5SMW1_9CRUS|nr:Protein canopy-like protein 2 [Armadillidium nasatum]
MVHMNIGRVRVALPSIAKTQKITEMQFKHIQFVIVIFSCLLSSSVFCNVPKSKVLKCAVCKSLVYEVKKAILEVDPRKTVEVGSFRINPDGQQEKVTKKYAGSETHMTELLEKICDEFKDYAQARHKETNKIEVIKLVEDGKMNPRFGEYEMIQGP